MKSPDGKPSDIVSTVYALRQAAIDHGLALATVQIDSSVGARDKLLETQIALEKKTAATIDECSDNAQSAEYRDPES